MLKIISLPKPWLAPIQVTTTAHASAEPPPAAPSSPCRPAQPGVHPLRAIRFAGVYAAALSLSGCITASTVPLAGASQYDAITPEEVHVFYSEEDIPGEYERIGVIYAEGPANMTNQRQMVEKMRTEAAKIGGNGVVMTGIQEPSAGAQVAGAVFGVSPQREGEFLVVRFDPNARRNSPASNAADSAAVTTSP